MINLKGVFGRPDEQIEKVTEKANCKENDAADEGDDFVRIHGLLADVSERANGDRDKNKLENDENNF